ncbi:hypothetical protein KC333_g922 [Hortaea werneckii]|nr:hypothetical protein KC333_g922 [Hortaea werneckii]KAI7323485.1 hypothetical protein KC326_g1510 [Hortaea werneckii]
MASSRRPTQSNQQQQLSQEQQQVTNSSWFLNSSTGLYYYYNAESDEFIYQNGTRVPRPSSIPRAGLLEQHREAGSNNSQQMSLSDSPNGRNDRRNYTYAADAQFDNRSSGGEPSTTDPRNSRSSYLQSGHGDEDADIDDDDDEQEEDSSAEEEEEDDDDEDDQVTEPQIHALTQRGYTRQEALRFIHLTQQQGYSREQAVLVIQYLRQGYTLAQAVMALQQSQQGPQGQQQQRVREQRSNRRTSSSRR